MTPTLQPLLTKQEVADLLRVHPRTVDEYERAGGLTVVRLPNRGRRYRREDVERFISERSTEGEVAL